MNSFTSHIGVDAPGRCSPGFGNCTAGDSATEPYIVGHNMLLAHSAAVKIYKTKYQVHRIGVLIWYGSVLNKNIL